jgi:polyhydroxyalkanoate synthesis regulator phasin
VKELEHKLLEMNNITPAKRNDLIYHYLLNKENIIIEQKNEMKLLQAELEQLRNIMYLQTNSNNGGIRGGGGGGGGGGGQQQQSLPAPPAPSGGYRYQPPRPVATPAPSSSQYYRGPANQLSNTSLENGQMGKPEAKFIILNEIRRLKDSLITSQEEKEKTFQQRLSDSHYYLSLSQSNQVLTHRINEMNRSSLAMKELLKQKIGNDGMLEMVESLMTMGIDAYSLLGTIPNPFKEQTEDNGVERKKSDISGFEERKKNVASDGSYPIDSKNMKKRLNIPEPTDYQKALDKMFLNK